MPYTNPIVEAIKPGDLKIFADKISLDGIAPYGTYRSFDHEPSEQEESEALEEIIQELEPYLKNAVIRKHTLAYNGEQWTVGIKVYL